MKRKTHIELLRIAACYWVIFNHTGTDGYFRFTLCPEQSARFWVYLLLSVFCRFSVPLFFAISGALLLGREEDLGTLFRRRVLKTAAVLLLFSFVYYLFPVARGEEPFSLYIFFGTLYTSAWNYSFWFLYAYLAFLLSLPMLRAMARGMKDGQFLYLFALALFFSGLLPVAEYLLWQGGHALNPNFRIAWLAYNIVMYPCLGYYLENRLDTERARKWLLPLWLLNLATLALSCYMTWYRMKLTGDVSEEGARVFQDSFLLIHAASAYVTAKCLAARWTARPHGRAGERLEKAVLSLGGCTFGIYLLHVMLLDEIPPLRRLWDLFRVGWGMNDMLAALLYCLIVLLLGWGLAWLLKKLPGLRRLL
ncbi:MAG: acyltransferase [Oscillospiraceae bacterium]|nr:acyltransferase [Oscillospiraceae bacterium]